MKGVTLSALLVCVWLGLFAQSTISLDSAIAETLKKHPYLKAAQLELEEQRALKKGSFSLPDPQLMLEAPTGEFFTPGIQQSIDNPLVYIQQSKVGKEKVKLAEAGIRISRAAVIRQASRAYNQLQYSEARARQAVTQDSIFTAHYLATDKRHKAGDVGLLELTSAEARAGEASVELAQTRAQLKSAQLGLSLLTGIDIKGMLTASAYEKLDYNESIIEAPSSGLFIDYANQNTVVARKELKLAKFGLAPDFSFGYMNQAELTSSTTYRFQFGLSLPLWFWTHTARIKAAKANAEKRSFEGAMAAQNFNFKWFDAIQAYQANQASLEYFDSVGLKQSDVILDAASRSYTAGEISYIEYLFSVSQAFEIKTNYYEALKKYNASVIELNYLKGK
ncbi:MAG TPA: TolC family protein [Flavobacteriales bacterium]|nr:TolC family protein [Flavobacteriales bacterium]HIA11218.1 TolC family protein [Flavobacteriales bacterium]